MTMKAANQDNNDHQWRRTVAKKTRERRENGKDERPEKTKARRRWEDAHQCFVFMVFKYKPCL